MNWHWSSSGQDSAFVRRQRRFESDPVLCDALRSLTIWLAISCAHDVVAAFLLAMQGVSVRFRLGAFFRTWESLVIPQLLWKQEIAGSNPAVLTS